MDEMRQMKDKFLAMIKKKKPAETASALPVRVNLPVELGGGFTVLMCVLRPGAVPGSSGASLNAAGGGAGGGQSVADFIKSLVSMLQNTNSTLLRAPEYGLTPHVERADDGLDAFGAPPVFLHPASLLADAFDEEEELNLDLRRLKPLKKGVDEPASALPAPSPTAPDHEANGGLNGKPRPPPPPPTPAAHIVLHYTCTTKLKRLRPPIDAPAEVLIVSTLVPPCALPAHLEKALPTGMHTGALSSSLQARSSAAAASAGSSAVAASSSAATSASANISTAKAAAKLQKQIDEYACHVYDLLLARGVGEDPHAKLRIAAARDSAPLHTDERIGTSAASGAAKGWGGWDEMDHRVVTDEQHEVPLLFVSTKKVPTPLPKKFDVTADCFVITNQRCLQIEAGVITEELSLGADSGNILKLPKATDDGEDGKCPIHLIVKNAIEIERALEAEAAALLEDEEDEEPDEPPANGNGGGRRGRRAAKTAKAKPASRVVSFFVPNPDIAGFLEEYLMYFQEKSSLEAQLGLVEQARLDRLAHASTERCLRGWTYLLKSLVGPMIFGPLRQPVYENSIKQVLAHVQQMDIKAVKITSLKLVEFRIPELDAAALAVAHAGGGDQIPSLRLVEYAGAPHHTYVFDIFWSAPSFYIKLEISGRKLVSFKLELEMRGVEVRGSLRLRSSPYAPEQAAVSFATLPQLSFGVGSHVIVGSIKLPFQRAIERVIYQQIQTAMENGLRENCVGDKWLSIFDRLEKSGLSLQLDRWWGMAQYPFKYDGTDDESMMSLALVVTSQAESGLAETVKEMRDNRRKMEMCLGHRAAPADKAASRKTKYTAAEHSRSNSTSQQQGSDDESPHAHAHSAPPPSSSAAAAAAAHKRKSSSLVGSASSSSRAKPAAPKPPSKPPSEDEGEEEGEEEEEEAPPPPSRPATVTPPRKTSAPVPPPAAASTKQSATAASKSAAAATKKQTSRAAAAAAAAAAAVEEEEEYEDEE